MIWTEYRLDKDELLDNLRAWNRILRKKVRLIACGGTAMTLLGIKASTKDVDFMVPDIKEYNYLIKQLPTMGYVRVTSSGWRRQRESFHFDIFRGNNIHTTELLESPLGAGQNKLFFELSRIYIGILNDYDLISSKLMRGTKVDFEDCVILAEAHRDTLDLERLTTHFLEMISYDVGEERLRQNIDHFLELVINSDQDE